MPADKFGRDLEEDLGYDLDLLDECDYDEDEGEQEFIIKCAKESSENAIQNAFDNGLSVTILEGNDIIRKYPDGRVVIVKHL